MAKEVLMPKLSSTMSTGKITQWFKEEGDKVSVGEPIFEVMTDKIAIEVESYDEGILLKKYYDVDIPVPVNSVIAYIGKADESVPEQPPVLEGEESVEKEIVEVVEVKAEETPTVSSDKVRATPAARKLARLKQIDLSLVTGSGPKGRVHVSDVESYQPATKMNKSAPTSETSLVPWSGYRLAIKNQMSKSHTEIPPVTENVVVQVDELMKLRKVFNSKLDEKLSYNDFILYFVSRVLKNHPYANATSSDKGITLHSDTNIGLAVSVENGLLVPVVHQANNLSLKEISSKTKELAEKAKTKKLVEENLTGGTFTITSLGTTRVRDFTPIINHPEACILGVGQIYVQPTFNEQDEVVKGHFMTLSLTFDHRVIDGHPAALFLSELADVIENPVSLLLV